ncbi:copper-translocating P-t [Wolfiporia cocos MD-104 SS10]|uniref:Copper-translocating P-t n=1 Tax=Wolfiporia cocos (strain MD-104) TaxID=742152 RepID=A0A2H3JRD0_WOLCO|nr:copper-translocating P-t [Wolfiporia cocos MD-104 SS10]
MGMEMENLRGDTEQPRHRYATQTQNTNSSCCDRGSCTCDDDCFDQLARVICAEDAGHIHEHTQDGDNAEDHQDSTDCTTCCADSFVHDGSATSEKAVLHQEHHENPAHIHIVDANCAYTGLRHRVPHGVESSTDHPSLPSKACSQHKSFANKRYGSTLAAFGCICRAMLAHGLQSCCTTKHLQRSRPGSLSARPLNASRTPSVISSRSCKSVASSCNGGGCCGINEEKRKSHESLHSRARRSVDSCCGGGACCASKSASRPSLNTCGGGSCCNSNDSGLNPSFKQTEGAHIEGINIDQLEKGTGLSNEHAILAIRGMTCTGCENKVIRVLRAIPAIRNVKTSLVLCRAEFDFDSSAAELQAVIQTIEKRTGFSVEKIDAGATHDLRLTIARTSIEDFLATKLPDGVEATVRADKDIVAVVYDPRIIGARHVLEYYAVFSPTLAEEPRDPAITAGLKHIRVLAIRNVACAFMTIPVLVMAWAPLPAHPRAYAIASLAFATVVQTAIMGPMYFGAFKSLFFSGLIETDMLVVLSTTAAYVYSVVAFTLSMQGHPLASGEFFETSTLLVQLITLGQLVSAFARQRALEAISIRALQQKTATVVHSDGREEVVDVRLLQYGDHFKVLPDSSIITDGTVRSGQSEVDESMMTGESRPVAKTVGSKVIAGTLNGLSTLIVEVDRLPGENTISGIAEMVDEARFSRARVQAIVDRICGWFVPVILAISTVTFVVWLAVGIAVRRQSRGNAAVAALTYAIAVLAISCPCAIGLAVPIVILIAGGVAARLGLVFKAATTLEMVPKITHVVFDKTGTLTEGRLAVVTSHISDGTTFNVGSVIKVLVKSSRHPVARAVAAHLDGVEVDSTAQLSKVEMVTGQGMQGTLLDTLLRGGSARWLEVENHPMVEPLLTKGLTTFCVIHNGYLIAVFGLEDTLRPESLFVINNLKKRHIEVSILSGDHPSAVAKISSELGIPHDRAKAACMPADKQAYLKALAAKGEKVLFCGDGTNDAIALAQADIGVHLQSDAGAGFAAASAADVVLTRPSLNGILALFELSQAVTRRIRLNFVWSALYNLVAILLAAGAFVDVRIAPAYAGLGEIVSVVPVVLVAFQLKWFKLSA